MKTVNSIPDIILLALISGRTEAARQALLKLVKTEPTNISGWLCLATTLPRGQAIQALRKALLLELDNPVVLRSLARFQENTRPDFRLELADIWPEEEPGEDYNPRLFGNEPPTINLGQLEDEARFGEEASTIPGAFLGFNKASNSTEASSLISALLAAFPAPPPNESAEAKVVELVGLDRSIAPQKPGLKPLERQPKKAAPSEKYIGDNPTTIIKRQEAGPEQNLAPIRKSKSVVDASWLSSNVNLSKAAKPVAAYYRSRPNYLPMIDKGIASRRNKLSKELTILPATYHKYGLKMPGSSQLFHKFQPRMPLLHTGARPGLGASEPPLVGFTGFGIMVSLLLGIVAVICLVLLIL
jgi:hypothetical protein